MTDKTNETEVSKTETSEREVSIADKAADILSVHSVPHHFADKVERLYNYMKDGNFKDMVGEYADTDCLAVAYEMLTGVSQDKLKIECISSNAMGALYKMVLKDPESHNDYSIIINSFSGDAMIENVEVKLNATNGIITCDCGKDIFYNGEDFDIVDGTIITLKLTCSECGTRMLLHYTLGEVEVDLSETSLSK